jgi:hypothetical protein
MRAFPFPFSRQSKRLGLLLALTLFLGPVLTRAVTVPVPTDEFSSLVKMAPFVVKGQSLAISIYARTNSDRKYGEKFAGEVAKVVFEGVTESTGRGLVIIGAKGEPHPIFVFRKFVALAKEGKLPPEVAARAPELAAMMAHWERRLNEGKSRDEAGDGDLPLDYDKIVTALPLPLEGVGAKLYQLAWEEKFDDAKVEAKLRALPPGDLERRDLFKRFDWVFYLPPKGAFDKVLDDLIAEALKQDDVGFFGRIAVKGVLLAVKPKVRRAIEGMRQGVMFMTVVGAQTPYTETEVSALTDAYMSAYLPDGKSGGGASDHDRAVNAVRTEVRVIAEKPKQVEAPPA